MRTKLDFNLKNVTIYDALLFVLMITGLKKGFGKAGTEVLIAVRKRRIKAEVMRPPFYKED